LDWRCGPITRHTEGKTFCGLVKSI
jgi:hypothetical protein